jgi:hypothetical protein
MELSQEFISFGKYKNQTITEVLKDRAYCKWLLEQPWFYTSYEYLYNRVKEYDPKIYFFKKYEGEQTDFLNTYKYFNLIPIDKLEIKLSETEIKCYAFYLNMIIEIKNKILKNIEISKPLYDIKAPVNWLKKFEIENSLSRDIFKEFINSYELANIPYIVEDIKKEGGIDYKGARSFNIAKQNSKDQEAFWEKILKQRYGENISSQYKYEKCIFDFLNIKTNTIFECKLGLRDFNLEQFKKYIIALKQYRIIYLIGYDCVINIEKQIIYTSNLDKYKSYQLDIPTFKNKSKFDDVIEQFQIIELKNIEDLFVDSDS